MKLKQGDTIGIISLSGDAKQERVENSRKYFEKLGYDVVLSKNILKKDRYLAGSDDEKIEELHSFFKNPEIKLIIASRGGYGTIRLINKLDYNLIKSNPKPLCGFSDVTGILLMIYKKCEIITYHSPMACVDFGDNINLFTERNFFDVINGKHVTFEGNKIYGAGYAEGILWGGNLSTVVSLCGQDFIPDKDFIFFTEELNEPVYKIDRMLRQLINIDKFRQNCRAIVLGDFLDVDNKEWLEVLFNETANELKIPMSGGYKITHNEEKITLPIGRKAVMEGLKLVI